MPRAIVAADPVDIFVGGRLRAARLSVGLSQTELARAMNLSFQQVQKYERGINRVSASMLVRAGKALNVPVADFFPADDLDLNTSKSIDISAIRGGPALSQCFAAMAPADRVVLLDVAKVFAQGSR